MKVARIAGYTIAGCLGILLALGVLSVLARIDTLLDNVNRSVTNTRAEIHGTLQNVNAVLIQTGLAADQARLAAQEQRQTWQRNSIEIGKTTRATRQLIDRTDRQVNDILLPSIRGNFDAITQNASQITQSLDTDLADLDHQINNPRIDEMVLHLDEVAGNSAKATAHADESLAHVDHVTAYYDKQLTSPRGFVKTLAKGLLQLVTPAASVATALK